MKVRPKLTLFALKQEGIFRFSLLAITLQFVKYMAIEGQLLQKIFLLWILVVQYVLKTSIVIYNFV